MRVELELKNHALGGSGLGVVPKTKTWQRSGELVMSMLARAPVKKSCGRPI